MHLWKPMFSREILNLYEILELGVWSFKVKFEMKFGV